MHLNIVHLHNHPRQHEFPRFIRKPQTNWKVPQSSIFSEVVSRSSRSGGGGRRAARGDQQGQRWGGRTATGAYDEGVIGHPAPRTSSPPETAAIPVISDQYIESS